jgi:hypothetical protein
MSTAESHADRLSMPRTKPVSRLTIDDGAMNWRVPVQQLIPPTGEHAVGDSGTCATHISEQAVVCTHPVDHALGV